MVILLVAHYGDRLKFTGCPLPLITMLDGRLVRR